MPIRISEEKLILFDVKQKTKLGRPPVGGRAQSSAGRTQLDDKQMLQKQILGQGDYKGESHHLNDPRNAIDRGPKIDDLSIAFNGIQHRSGAYDKEHKKHRPPDAWGGGNPYRHHFHGGGSDALIY